jgi:hypothetical protein
MDKIVPDAFITVEREIGKPIAHLKTTFGPDGMETYARVNPDDLPTPSKNISFFDD